MTQNPQPTRSGLNTGGANVRPTPSWAIALAWAVVAIPAGWGIAQTIQKSMQLFTSAPAATEPSAPPAR